MEPHNQEEEETKLGVWGNNRYGQLALDNNNMEQELFIPKMITFSINITEISCGFEHTLFRSISGEIFTTGNNSKGQLGIDIKIKRRTSPTAISLQDSNEKTLLACANGYHNIIYTEYGKLYSWGDNSYGQLGTGDFEDKDIPFEITDNLEFKEDKQIIQISLGKDHSAILLNDGKVFTWGNNNYFQLGIEEVENNMEVNYPVAASVEKIKKIACGYDQTLFLNKEGLVFVCGNNKDSRLMINNDTEKIKKPTHLQTPEKVKKVFASQYNAIITEKDDLFIWGLFCGDIIDFENYFEDTHNEDLSSKKGSSNYNVNKSQTKIRIETVGLGEDFLVAVNDYGDCFSWGNNEKGQLGLVVEEDETGIVSFEPYPKKMVIFQPFDVKSVHIGLDFSLLLLVDKTPEHYEGSMEYVPPYNIVEGDEQEELMEEYPQKNEEYIDPENVEEEDEEEEDPNGSEYSEPDESEQDQRINLDPMNDKDQAIIGIFRMLVYLYEDLRYKLIKIIDENVDVDNALDPEIIELIKRQQDIIDEYLKMFNLKVNVPFELSRDNLYKFEPGKADNFKKKYFEVNDEDINIMKNNENSEQKIEIQKILQKLKVEREIVAERLSQLKVYVDQNK